MEEIVMHYELNTKPYNLPPKFFKHDSSKKKTYLQAPYILISKINKILLLCHKLVRLVKITVSIPPVNDSNISDKHHHC